MRLLVVVAIAACGRGNFEVDADTDSPITSWTTNIAFVTSTTHSISELGSSLAGADAICTARATEVHLPGTYLALLSTTTTSARQRLGSSRGWVRVDGKPLVDRIDDLFGAKLRYPITIDEQGATAFGQVITASNADGSFGNASCGDFTDTSAFVSFGDEQATANHWISGATDACSRSYRLYCFGVGNTTPPTVTAASGRKAFVTVQPFTVGSGGIGAADILCASEATAAGLTGTFSALLPTSAASASSRFNLGGAPWVRTDGVQLATTSLGFMAGNLDAPLNVTAVGTYSGGYVWTGGSFAAPQPSQNTCGDWQIPGDTASLGLAEFVGGNALLNTSGAGCGTPQLLYCLEQ